MAYTTAAAGKEFDHWSRRYDRDPLQPFFFQPTHRMLLEYMGPWDRRVLDVGCGTGQFAVQVVRRFPGTEVFGLDLSRKMLLQGQSRCHRACHFLHFVQGDSARIPFPADTFDIVTCAHSFHHYPDQQGVIEEMYRVLRPGGRLLLVDGDRDRWWGHFIFDKVVVFFEGPVQHLASRTLRSHFRKAGFEDIHQRRRRGPFPFLMTLGHAAKRASSTRRAA